MTLVNSIDKIVSWLTENVCSKITLKLPDDYRNDTGYDVVMVNQRRRSRCRSGSRPAV